MNVITSAKRFYEIMGVEQFRQSIHIEPECDDSGSFTVSVDLSNPAVANLIATIIDQKIAVVELRDENAAHLRGIADSRSLARIVFEAAPTFVLPVDDRFPLHQAYERLGDFLRHWLDLMLMDGDAATNIVEAADRAMRALNDAVATIAQHPPTGSLESVDGVVASLVKAIDRASRGLFYIGAAIAPKGYIFRETGDGGFRWEPSWGEICALFDGVIPDHDAAPEQVQHRRSSPR